MMMVPSYKGRQERETERQRNRDTETPRLRDTERQRETARQRDREAERQRGQGAGAKNTPHRKQQTKRKKLMQNHSNPWMKKRVWKKRGSQTFNLFKYKKNPPAPKARAKNFPKKVPPRGRDTERQADRYRGRGRERERKRETETETETESATATSNQPTTNQPTT